MCGGVNCSSLVVTPNTDKIDFNFFQYPKQKVFDEDKIKEARDKAATKDVLESKTVLPKIEIGPYATLKLIKQSDTNVTSISTDSQGNEVYNTKLIGTNLGVDQIGSYTEPKDYIKTGIIIGLFLAELCAKDTFNDRFYSYLYSIVVDLQNMGHRNILTGLYIFLQEYKGFTRTTHRIDSVRSVVSKNASVGSNVDAILSGYKPAH